MPATAIPRKPFGRTGFDASILGLGGVPIGDEPMEDGIAVVNRAVDLGINYIDTADCYGHSEETIGEALGPRRDEVFLATKYCARDGGGAEELLHRSLKRLRTDRIDLFQLHCLHSMEDLDTVFAEEGAIRVAIRAQEEGLVRFLGITAHAGPPAIAEALRRYPFASVLVPISAIEPFYMEEVLSAAEAVGAAVNGMKLGAAGGFRSADLVAKSLRYNLTLPTNVTLLGMRTVEQVQFAVSVTLTQPPLSAEELQELRSDRQAYGETDPHAFWWRTGRSPSPDGWRF